MATTTRADGDRTFQPDQNLLFVRGFDPATKQFKYSVNDRFGSTRPQQSASRSAAFVSINVSYDIGFTRERQMLTQRLDAGRGRPGTKQTAQTLKAFGTASIPNPMSMILQQPDSLQLTRQAGGQPGDAQHEVLALRGFGLDAGGEVARSRAGGLQPRRRVPAVRAWRASRRWTT